MNPSEYQLYPIELSLNRVKKAWGGWPGKIGEVWSLSAHPHENLALNGKLAGRRLTEIVGGFQQRLLGKDIELDPREPFPFLLKFISAAKNLTIQVHPDDAYTIENGLSLVGRDKMFYILAAKPDARIYLGFKDRVSEKIVREAVDKGTLHRLLNPLSVKSGELYSIPAGRIHSIGKGIIIFEIQRHSDLTFRLSEWDNEIKSNAGPSQLDEAFKVLDFNPVSPKPIPKVTISSDKSHIEWLGLTPRFVLRRLFVRESLEFSLRGNRFMVYTGLRGTGWLRWGLSDMSTFIQPFQSILVPAIPEDIYFESEDGLELLETSVPDLAGETLDQMIEAGIRTDRIAGLRGEDYSRILKEYMG